MLPNGNVLVVGGLGRDGGTLDAAEVWDPETSSFGPAGTLAEARSRHTATLLPDGRLLVVGGLKGVDESLASAEVWDPATASFEPAGSLAEARDGHTATLLPNGNVLVVGGYSRDGGYRSAAEVWDRATATFGPAGSLGKARGFHSATLLLDGRVLVVGGYDGEWLASAEVWDPATGVFGPAGTLGEVRDLHTATLLPDGRVLVTGGYNDHYLASAEVWDPRGQSIDLAPLPEVLPVTAGPFDVAARATSGMPVILGTEGSCALVEGSRLTLLGVGGCSVTASQPGDVRWAPAVPVRLTIDVVPVADGDVRLIAASTLPPTFVAPTAVVHAITDPNRAPSHYYGMWLEAGATLHPLAVADERILGVSVSQAPVTWTTDATDLSWNDVGGLGWLAPTTGLVLVRVADASGPGSPYRYTLSFTVVAPRPLSTIPPAGSPGRQGRARRPGRRRTARHARGVWRDRQRLPHPRPTLGGSSASTSSLAICSMRRPEGGVTLQLAYPSDPGAWYPLDGPWLASEPGTYSVRVSAGVVGGGRAIHHRVQGRARLVTWRDTGIRERLRGDPPTSRKSAPFADAIRDPANDATSRAATVGRTVSVGSSGPDGVRAGTAHHAG